MWLGSPLGHKDDVCVRHVGSIRRATGCMPFQLIDSVSRCQSASGPGRQTSECRLLQGAWPVRRAAQARKNGNLPSSLASIRFYATAGQSGRTPCPDSDACLQVVPLEPLEPLDSSSVICRRGGGIGRNHLTRHRARARPCAAHHGVWTAFPSSRCPQQYRAVSPSTNASAILREGQSKVGEVPSSPGRVEKRGRDRVLRVRNSSNGWCSDPTWMLADLNGRRGALLGLVHARAGMMA